MKRGPPAKASRYQDGALCAFLWRPPGCVGRPQAGAACRGAHLMEPAQRSVVSSRCLWLSDASQRKSRPSGPLDTARGLRRGSRAGRTVTGHLCLCRARTTTSSKTFESHRVGTRTAVTSPGTHLTQNSTTSHSEPGPKTCALPWRRFALKDPLK